MRMLRLDLSRRLTALALAGAAAFAAVPRAQAQEGELLHAVAPPRAAVLTGVRTAYSDGDRIGSVNAGVDCSASSERAWSPLVRRRIETEVGQVFREEFAKASATRPVGAKSTPLRVHAFLNDLDVAVCQVAAGAWQGGFHVRVGWQIVAPETGKVLYQASTEGSFTLASPQRVTSAAALREAFGEAVRSLLSDRRFTAMLQQNDSRQLAMADAI